MDLKHVILLLMKEVGNCPKIKTVRWLMFDDNADNPRTSVIGFAV